MGEFFDEHIARIQLNTAKATFTGFDKHSGKLLPPNDDPDTSKDAVDIRLFSRDHYHSRFLQAAYELSELTATDSLKSMLAEGKSLSSHRNTAGKGPNEVGFCGRQCHQSYRIEYECDLSTKETMQQCKRNLSTLALSWSLMSDIRANRIRTEYAGILPFKAKFTNQQDEVVAVFLVPKK